jgi:hypothetical protein
MWLFLGREGVMLAKFFKTTTVRFDIDGKIKVNCGRAVLRAEGLLERGLYAAKTVMRFRDFAFIQNSSSQMPFHTLQVCARRRCN